MNLTVHYLNGGYCRHPLFSVDGKSLRTVKFHSVFLAIHHPVHGWILCDTGYGGKFAEATHQWPFRLYRWVTPVTSSKSTTQKLEDIGLKPKEISRIILTHFHADHIGGLMEFPDTEIVFHEHALAPLSALSPLAQVKAAFLPSLLPSNIRDRSSIVLSRDFSIRKEFPFRIFDLFGDNSLSLVELPGHAPGQVGLLYAQDEKPTLYCADAYWRSEQIADGLDLPALTRDVQWDPNAYVSTIQQLRVLEACKTHRLLSCHCQEIQAYVRA